MFIKTPGDPAGFMSWRSQDQLSVTNANPGVTVRGSRLTLQQTVSDGLRLPCLRSITWDTIRCDINRLLHIAD